MIEVRDLFRIFATEEVGAAALCGPVIRRLTLHH